MAANSIPNLPNFLRGESDRSATFTPGQHFGIWEHAKGSLGQLGRSMDLPDQPWADRDEPIRAIPDPWAQARAFGEALLDDKHSMHEDVRGKWRALLALLALRHLHAGNYALAPSPVSLDGANLFARVMRELPPSIALGGHVSQWTKPWLIMITPAGQPPGPVPLAMTNPICLVSPGRVSGRFSLNGVAWARGDLADPLLRSDDLAVTELLVIEKWVTELARELEQFGDEVGSKLRELLTNYATECRTLLGNTTIKVAAIATDQPRLAPLFHHLFLGARLEDDPAGVRSSTLIALRPDVPLGNFNGVILVDEAIGTLPGLDPRRCIVWGVRTLHELLQSRKLFDLTKEEAAKRGYWLVTADDLFTDRLVRIGKEGRIDSHPSGLQDIVLPLRPLAMLLKGELRNLVSGQSQPGRASITLKLELTGGVQLDLIRQYSSNGASGDSLLVEEADWELYNATLWPNFKADCWSTYVARFVYLDALRGQSLRPELALSRGLIAAEVADAGNGEVATLRLAALNRGDPPRKDDAHFLRSEKREGGRYEDIQLLRHPIDALLYYEGAGKRLDTPAGMVLIALDPIEGIEATRSVAAVDFGTTNTVACFQNDRPITFQKRVIFPVQYRSPEDNRDSKNNLRYLLSKFFSPDDRNTPTPTVAITRSADATNSLFRNLIYFHSNEQHAVNGEQQELRELGQIATESKYNLKWREDSAHVDAASDYLEQFMLMIAAEAAAQKFDPRLISWRFSIPDSLIGRQRENFQKHLRKITRRISTAIPQEDRDNPALKPLYSEGLAAASYMLLNKDFDTDSLNVVLDIGGGTTDATIWDRQDLMWKGSFRLAGQNFFTRTLTQNPTILRAIGLDQWAGLLDGSTKIDDPRFEDNKPQIAEILFSGDRLPRAIDEFWERRLALDVGAPLRLAALVMLGGVAWYTGRVALALKSDGTLGEAAFAKQAFALCGRGAGVFKKIHGGYPEDSSDVTRVLQLFSVAAQASTAKRPQVFSSRDAKLEVVRGMIGDSVLIDASAEGGRSHAKEYLPAGLGLSYVDSAEPTAPADLIGPNILAAKVLEVDMAEFDAFVDALESYGGIRLNAMASSQQGARAFVQGAVRRQIETERREQVNKGALEPPFISALRELVEILAGPAETRAKRLTIDFL